MQYNCLIVDDEIDLAKMTAEYFEMFGVTTAYVESSAACYDFLKENSADLILLDINLGDGSGFDVCKKLREEYNLPILFISARQGDDDILVALSIGGDDYIKKPYSLSVLLAKVKVNLKRFASASNQIEKTSEGSSFSLDDATMSVCIKGSHIHLKAKEYALIKCLFDHKNTIVTKETLFDEVWGDSFYADGTLNVHIRKLREKIEKNPNEPEYIKTIWGTGYILEIKE
ncbi:MAG: response regulator transcription factor [Lachnospiraceae bacterium]|nr:response regulator transcription factor [Lachnospiraceae bacterium]